MRLPELDFSYDEPEVGFEILRMHFNENLFLPPQYYAEIAPEVGERELKYYTDPNNLQLARKIEEYHSLGRDTVTITAGADEGLRLVMTLVVHMGGGLAIVEPTYGMARILARQVGLAPLTLTYEPDLSLDVDAVVKSRASAVYICSPNNPTAHLVKEVEELVSRFDGLVILDAAYAEYAGMWRPTFHEYGNVAEVRTFAKAWGLAGARVGYVTASPRVTKLLRTLSLPHPISAHSAKLIERALEVGRPYVERAVVETTEVREWAAPQIKHRKYVGPTNFITLILEDAEAVAKRLWQAGIAVRTLGGKPHCPACLRFTLAPRLHMERLLKAL